MVKKQKMQALVKERAEVGLQLRQVPVPDAPAAQEVLIKVRKAAICGTDVHIWNWDAWAQKTLTVPLVVGHEFVGEVAACGTGVDDLKVGELVTGEGHITCACCRNCLAGKRHLCRQPLGVGVERAGAFADFILLPRQNVYRIATGIDEEVAAIYDPLGNAAHTALEFDLVGEDVLVTGAGPIGLMVTAIARHVGARYVVTTDVNPQRLQLAKKMGADLAVNAAKTEMTTVMQQLGMQEGFDIGFEMSGNDAALRQMLGCLNHGAKVSLLGIFTQSINVDWNEIILKGITMRGIYGRKMFDTWYKVTSMLQSGLNIAQVITHRYPVQEFHTAFEQMRSGQSGKVIIEWS